MKIDIWKCLATSCFIVVVIIIISDLFSVFWLLELRLHSDTGRKQYQPPILLLDLTIHPLGLYVFLLVFFESVDPHHQRSLNPRGIFCISILEADFEHKKLE